MTIVDARSLAGIRHLERPGQRAGAFEVQQVGRAGQHDVLALAVIELAQHQAVGVGMRHHLSHRGDHDLIRLPGQARDFGVQLAMPAAAEAAGGHGQAGNGHLFHFEAGHGQAVGQLVQGKGNVNEIA